MSRFKGRPRKIIDPNADIKQAKTRVVIAIPAQDSVATGFAYDLARLVGFTASTQREIELRLEINKGTALPEQRHQLVCAALTAEATHILFIDGDMRFPKDSLVRLLSHREPVVGANYTRRQMPISPVAEVESGPFYTEADATELAPVHHVGMGLMLVDLDLVKQLPPPWFLTGFDPRTGQYVSEDVYFCQKVREHGLSVLVDPVLSRQVGHLGEWEFRSEHALQTRDLMVPDKAESGT